MRLAFCILCLIALPVLAEPTVELLVQTSPLAGFQYHAGRALWPLMQVGDALTLVREPWNPYDTMAIRVEWRGVTIGYVPRKENRDLARIMDKGARPEGHIVHLQRSRNPWRRVLFDVRIEQKPETQAVPAVRGSGLCMAYPWA